jgi:hypothetical protein
MALIAGLTPLCAIAAPAGPSDREQHTAECVAALDLGTQELAGQVKAGRQDLKPLLLDRLKSGAAFIGAAYRGGERDEARSKALLKDALDAQKTLSKPVLEARQVSCAEEGTRLLEQAGFLEREVVDRFAERRLNKLLRR